MSKLEELINQLCPDGVEYVKIKECIKSVKNIKWKEHEDQKFHYIDLASVDRETHSVLDTQIITSANAPSRAQQIVECNDVLLGTTRPMLKRFCLINDEYSGEICSTGFCVLRPNLEKILPAWLLHNISSDAFFAHVEKFQKGASYPAITDAEVKTFCIPLPPLPVQEEIVRILDNMTSLTAELTAELKARQKQYEYYRESLLSFDEDNAQDGVRWMKLGELFPSIRNGFVGTVTPYFTDADNGVRYLKGTNIHNGVISDNDVEYVTRAFHQKHIKTELKADDILMVQSGHVGECAVVGEKYAGANCHALIVLSNGGECLSQYIAYYLQSKQGKKKLKAITTGGTVKHILASAMKKFEVPVPTLEEQQRIVDILDRFDKLCNDISEGLPAEIEARKKQYEYYRDKLLTFKEKEA